MRRLKKVFGLEEAGISNHETGEKHERRNRAAFRVFVVPK
jgi:hypothetical protein